MSKDDERKTLHFEAEHHLARQRRMYRELDRERQTGNRESESALENYRRIEEEIDEMMGIKDTDSDEVIAQKTAKFRAIQTAAQLALINNALNETINQLVEKWGGSQKAADEAQAILDYNLETATNNKEYRDKLHAWVKNRITDPFMKLVKRPEIKWGPK